MDLSTSVISVLIILLGIIYAYIKYKFSYWERKNVPFIPPEFPFGNIKNFGKTGHTSQVLDEFYYKLKGKGLFGGLYFSTSPTALITDLDLIKHILIKDFHHFQERGLYYNEKDDPLSAHLFNLEEHKWKNLRAKLTPTFTSGKMKFMYPTILEVAKEFEQCLATQIEENPIVEIKDLLARFTTDVIGTCAFGIECNSLKNPNVEFRQKGVKVFGKPRHSLMVVFLMAAFRSAARALGMKLLDDDVSEFFMKIVNQTIAYREKNDVRRNDFMDLLIELKNKGTLDGDTMSKLTIEEIAAQAFIFFFAGFETSSTTMGYCLYELCQNPDMQEKARQEIRSVLEKHKGQFSYEAMKDMHYLNTVLQETLRKYPPATALIRTVTKDYPVPNTDIILDRNTLVMIPIFSVHRDPEYFPEPDRFDPDRFTPEKIQERPQMTHLPFGDGPRNCIGLRFGMMQARVGLVTMLNNFEFRVCSKTMVPIKFSKNSRLLGTDGGLYFSVKKI